MNRQATNFVPTTGVEGMIPPYHIFECQGEYFLYDTLQCVFFTINKATKDFLTLCLQYKLDEAKCRFLTMEGIDEKMAQTIFHEVELMRNNGLFLSPLPQSINQQQFEQLLDDRYNSSWSKLELALSESCNLACRYCYCAHCRDMENKGLMTQQVARMAITWLFAVSGKAEQLSITFFGGEPLLNKPVFKFAIEYSQKLAKLHGKKIFYSMTTNGTLLDDEIITYIKRYNFGLMVSLDGPQELRDGQCPTQGGHGSYDLAVKGIRKLMARRRAVTVRGTMIHPLPNMLKLIKFYEDFGFTRIVLCKATNPDNPSPVDCNASDIDSYFEQLDDEIIPWMLDKIKQGEIPKYYPFTSFIESYEKGDFSRSVPPFRCGACRGTTTVGANGDLYPCHRFVGLEAWKIGNINDGPDIDACKDFWRNYRVATSKCSTCAVQSLCKGPCPWEIAQKEGSFKMPDVCDHNGAYVSRALSFYHKKARLNQ